MKLLSTAVAGLLAVGQASAGKTSISKCLDGKGVPASYPGDNDYTTLAEPFNQRLHYKPAAIALPKNNKHVQDAVVCAGKSALKVQAKSGGHSYASFSSGGKDGSMSTSV